MPASPGSSPRPWGTLRRRRWTTFGQRFIPTPVGNAKHRLPAGSMTYGSSPRPWGTRGAATLPARQPTVHPHARGERGTFTEGGRVYNGSSPRPWGTRLRRSDQALNFRFIPTPVGNARAPCSRQTRAPVHPHARGERLLVTVGLDPANGSSPRPWGTHVLQPVDFKAEKRHTEIYRSNLPSPRAVKGLRHCPALDENSPVAPHQNRPACAGSCPAS